MQEEHDAPLLSTITPIKAGAAKDAKKGAGSVGDTALKDALIIIIICWVIVFSVWFSLRPFNI